MLYIRVNTDGSRDEIESADDFISLQKMVGGSIERVKAGRKWGWVDEEGRCKCRELNTTASIICGFPIFGPLVFKK